jgi:vancomycin resistance protein YoaR
LETAPPDRRFRRPLLVVVACLTVVIAAFIGYYQWLGGGIPRGTTVHGIHVGGMTPAAAETLLRRELGGRLEPTTIRSGGESMQLVLARHGVSIDAAATVASLPSRRPDPRWLIGNLFTRDHEAIVRVDKAALARGLEPLALKVTSAPIEGDVIFRGVTPVAVEPQAGTALDVRMLAEAIRSEWLRGRADFSVAVVPSPSNVTVAAVVTAIESFARPAMSAPIVVLVDGHPVTITPTVLASALDFRIEGNALVPVVRKRVLTTALGAEWSNWTVPARDATFTTVSGKVRVVPSMTGRDVEEEALSNAIVAAMLRPEGERTASVYTVDVEPRLTTQAATDLDLRDRIGHFQTHFPWTWYRAHNIHRAADILNGTIIQPDEVFSLNGTLGKRTAANGFVEGVAISGGRLSMEFGGGVSQVATTTWNAAWFAGLELLQHKPHSFYISRYPVGRESTVSWPNVDVKFRNDTGKPILITTSYYSNHVTVSIYGTRKYEVETITGPRTNPTTFKTYEDDSTTCITQDGIGGFTIEVTRILKQGGVEVSRKVYRTRYLAEDRVRCTNPDAVLGSTPTPKPKPKPTATPTPSASETTPVPTPSP